MMFWRAWERYWFRPAPVFDLAVVRLIAVAFQLHHLSTVRPRADFGSLAALPDFMYAPVFAMRILTLPFGWDYRPSEDVVVTIYWLTVLAGVFALIGYRTTLSLIVFAAGNVYVQGFEYSFREVHHPEAIVIIAIALLALAPSGAALSLDDWLTRRRGSRGSTSAVDSLEVESRFARWPLLVIQWMFALIYFSAAFHKLTASGLEWMNGWTLQYYMVQDSMRWGNDASGLGAGVAAEPGLGVWLGLHHEVAVLASWMSILFETTFWLVLIFPRLAFLFLPIGVGFHVAVYIIQRAPFLSFVWLYAAFVPWRDLVRHVSAWRDTRVRRNSPNVALNHD